MCLCIESGLGAMYGAIGFALDVKARDQFEEERAGITQWRRVVFDPERPVVSTLKSIKPSSP